MHFTHCSPKILRTADVADVSCCAVAPPTTEICASWPFKFRRPHGGDARFQIFSPLAVFKWRTDGRTDWRTVKCQGRKQKTACQCVPLNFLGRQEKQKIHYFRGKNTTVVLRECDVAISFNRFAASWLSKFAFHRSRFVVFRLKSTNFYKVEQIKVSFVVGFVGRRLRTAM